jgi:hypothetical protein
MCTSQKPPSHPKRRKRPVHHVSVPDVGNGQRTDRKLMTSVPVSTMHEDVHQWTSEDHQDRQILRRMIRMAVQQVYDRHQHDGNDHCAQDGWSGHPLTNGGAFDQPTPISVCTHHSILKKQSATTTSIRGTNVAQTAYWAATGANHPQMSECFGEGSDFNTTASWSRKTLGDTVGQAASVDDPREALELL